LQLFLRLYFWLSFRSAAEESASVVAFADAFLVVILSAAKNLLLAREARVRSCLCF
jgi:hypothetical protein